MQRVVMGRVFHRANSYALSCHATRSHEARCYRTSCHEVICHWEICNRVRCPRICHMGSKRGIFPFIPV
jgi:hypothetical protein